MKASLAAALFLSLALPLNGAGAGLVTLNRGEQVVFYGDSISCTGMQSYTMFLETYLRLRYPGLRMSVMNLSWPGETSATCLRRFPRDVAPARPTMVIVNLGMNDGISGGKRVKPGPRLVREFHKTQAGLSGLIKKAGARELILTPPCVDSKPVVESPSIEFDQGGTRFVTEGTVNGFLDNHNLEFFPQYNSTLQVFSGELSRIGKAEGVPVIDLLEPMLEIQQGLRKNIRAPSLTIDSIHPSPAGSLIMAYLILKRLRVAGSAGKGGGSEASCGQVALGLAGPGEVNYRLNLTRYPLYIPRKAQVALSLVPFEEEFNSLVLKTPGWNGGKGHLFCDSRYIGEFAGEEIAGGIDLALVEWSPWVAQARKFQDAIYRFHDEVTKSWVSYIPEYRIREFSSNISEPIDPKVFQSFKARSARLSLRPKPGGYRLALFARNPLTDPARRPWILESWEGDNPVFWEGGRNGEKLESSAREPSNGSQCLVVMPSSEAAYQARVSSDLNPHLDLGGVKKFAVDLRGSVVKGEYRVSLGIRDGGGTRGEVASTGGEITGEWRTFEFLAGNIVWDKGSILANGLKDAAGINLDVVSAGSGAIARLEYDNLRILE